MERCQWGTKQRKLKVEQKLKEEMISNCWAKLSSQFRNPEERQIALLVALENLSHLKNGLTTELVQKTLINGGNF